MIHRTAAGIQLELSFLLNFHVTFNTLEGDLGVAALLVGCSQRGPFLDTCGFASSLSHTLEVQYFTNSRSAFWPISRLRSSSQVHTTLMAFKLPRRIRSHTDFGSAVLFRMSFPFRYILHIASRLLFQYCR